MSDLCTFHVFQLKLQLQKLPVARLLACYSTSTVLLCTPYSTYLTLDNTVPVRYVLPGEIQIQSRTFKASLGSWRSIISSSPLGSDGSHSGHGLYLRKSQMAIKIESTVIRCMHRRTKILGRIAFRSVVVLSSRTVHTSATPTPQGKCFWATAPLLYAR